MQRSTPTQDSSLAHAYGVNSLEYKVQNKTALQEELGWESEPKRPVLCLPSGMTDQLGGRLLIDLLPGLLSLPIEILIRGKGSSTYGALFTRLAKEYGHRVAILPDDPKSCAKMYAAADCALFLANASDQAELKECLKYGTVPLAPVCDSLKNYNPNQESGESFLYEKPTVWHAYAAVVRALETFRFPFDWRTIQKHGMEKNAA